MNKGKKEKTGEEYGERSGNVWNRRIRSRSEERGERERERREKENPLFVNEIFKKFSRKENLMTK